MSVARFQEFVVTLSLESLHTVSPIADGVSKPADIVQFPFCSFQRGEAQVKAPAQAIASLASTLVVKKIAPLV